MAATALFIQNQITKETEKIKFKVPTTASEAYTLGITMSSLFLHILTILSSQCKSEKGREILNLFAAQEEKEIKTFSSDFKFALNCEITRFYQSGGTIIPLDISKEQIAETKLLITRNLENFFNWMQEIENSFANNPSPDASKYFNTKNVEDVFATCMKARMSIIGLYRRLAKLYPKGNISKAFEEMALTLEKGNENLLI
ncbi:hypothetical protein [Thermosyntropha sp.]|uniref:hypothetical protein n=1 Tax=Thermosyntropha sp. TaxID=2740820 RepID=UPI0025DA522A|nr:hypothetical protein [Thermosyntropha sp.]MBO8158918.1 hypothetical protein [Thermosyntropha sp.]